MTAALALLLVVWFIDVLLRNPAFEWAIVIRYIFEPSIMRGLVTTLWLTGAVTLLSVLFGTLIAAARLSPNFVLQIGAWGYVWIFRSTPLLVQLLFWFNIGYLFPKIGFGLPWLTPFIEIDSRDLISPIASALLGLTLHMTSYASEIIRGGIMAVPSGQIEAAEVLGLSPTRIFTRIILPQSMRSIIPSIGNLLIDTLKSTSVISVLAVPDLLYSVQLIYNKTYKVVPLLMVATLWYITVTTILSSLQYYIERYFARGSARELPPTPLQRARGMAADFFRRLRDKPAATQPEHKRDHDAVIGRS
ncbi:amino acid ABC transporter permease (plasmid) [Agrobacterium tumefaciens]|uniref:Amino acid ABC transporter permease n=1 Tax=Agrobacterium tumefaciens TaxID=358 RepID=A0AAP9J988_AGRTU|nr:amino acid ABC transporter permease [Agrobacterium tumefaciens]NTZ64197.1 amino acid ABC transporter permease [Agrobacterium tumefaciens]QDY97803.1 amino acid ABC transporter permease [Agrobacterium tumefaciens]UXS12933.1 amino acid ABC transporter permease [Agrobacterium tumefaciens]UXS20296.1 amino acid ABC transporter permease [Agrobacterium tumefaciens]